MKTKMLLRRKSGELGRLTMKMYVPSINLQDFQPSNSVQGFDALLEPFYQGKSLTERIDTAKV